MEWGIFTLKPGRAEPLSGDGFGCACPLAVAAALSLLAASPAVAQVSGPFTGIAPRSSAAPGSAQKGLADQFQLTPAINTIYDSNPLRLNDTRGGSAPRSDVRVTPALAFDVRQNFARNSISINGAVGYDFYRRFKGLERLRTDVRAAGVVPFGGRCRIAPEANLQIQQADIEDLGVAVGRTVKLFNAQMNAQCRRSSGFYPVAGAGVLRLTNNGNDVRQNRKNWNATGGLVYAKPSLGEVQLFVNAAQFRRPGGEAGVDTGADLVGAGLQFDRSITSRFAIRTSVSAVEVSPNRLAATRFRGINYVANIRVAPIPSVILSPFVSRQIAANINTGADYALTRDVGVGIDWSLGVRSGIVAQIGRTRRRYFGEEPLIRNELRIADVTDAASAAFRYSVRSLQLRLGVQQRERVGKNAFYDFSSTRVEFSARAGF